MTTLTMRYMRGHFIVTGAGRPERTAKRKATPVGRGFFLTRLSRVEATRPRKD